MARRPYTLNVNGDFEGDAQTKGWSIGNGTLTQVPTAAGATWAGTSSLQWLRESGTSSWSLRGGLFGVKSGRVYTLSGSANPSTDPSSLAFPRLEFFDANSASLGTLGNDYTATPGSSWTTRTATVTAPVGAVSACLNCGMASTVTTAVQMDELWAIGEFDVQSTLQSAHPGPNGDWLVNLAFTTDANSNEYGAWQLFKDNVSQRFILGTMPATLQMTQAPNTTSVWRMQLYKNVQYPGAPTTEWRPISRDDQGRVTVSSDQPPGKSVIVTADGSASAYVEIQSWPERVFTRQSVTLPVLGQTSPVVNSDVITLPTSSPVFITRTISDRNALALVLAAPGPHHLIPYCTQLGDEPWFMPLDFTQNRAFNRPDRAEWLTEVQIQEVDAPATAFAASAPTLSEPQEPGAAQ